MSDKSYNGWANWETWNVSLWIQNDEGLYSVAKAYQRSEHPYKAFVASVRDIGDDVALAFETPDGAAWNDSGLDIDALDEMIREL